MVVHSMGPTSEASDPTLGIRGILIGLALIAFVAIGLFVLANAHRDKTLQAASATVVASSAPADAPASR